MNFPSRTSITDINEHTDTHFRTYMRTLMSAGTRGQKCFKNADTDIKKFQNADKDIKKFENADMDIKNADTDIKNRERDIWTRLKRTIRMI